MKPYILWLGAIFDEKQILNSKAISPAANNWQRGLIEPLAKKGTSIIMLGHTPEPIWPRGNLQINYDKYKSGNSITCYLTGYLNAPFIRNKILISRYWSLLQNIIKANGKPKCVITYNPYPHNSETAIKLQKKLKIPWICIVADMPTSKTEISKHKDYIAHSDGVIFLSWDMYKNSKSPIKLHLEGGVTQVKSPANIINPNTVTDKKIIVYAGSLTKWGGVDLLIEAFKLINRTDIELWICGPGKNSTVEYENKTNQNINYLGFVNKKKLNEIYETASIFVNPRPSNITGNEYNFPSKLFEYMSYLKPIVSTKTLGISPEYENILIVCENESPLTISEKINYVLDWDESKIENHRKDTAEFISKEKTWKSQTERLTSWLSKEFSLSFNG